MHCEERLFFSSARAAAKPSPASDAMRNSAVRASARRRCKSRFRYTASCDSRETREQRGAQYLALALPHFPGMRPRRGRVSYELPTSGASLLDPAAAPLSDAPGSSIDEEASIDPPPAVDAQTLSAYLYQHAETARQRSAALEAKLRAEEAAEVRGHR